MISLKAHCSPVRNDDLIYDKLMSFEMHDCSWRIVSSFEPKHLSGCGRTSCRSGVIYSNSMFAKVGLKEIEVTYSQK